MNMHGIVANVISAVNPLTPVTVQITTGTTQAEWEQLSPGYRRTIVEEAKKAKAREQAKREAQKPASSGEASEKSSSKSRSCSTFFDCHCEHEITACSL